MPRLEGRGIHLNLARDELLEVIFTMPESYYHGRGWEHLAVVCEGACVTEVRNIKQKKASFARKVSFLIEKAGPETARPAWCMQDRVYRFWRQKNIAAMFEKTT